MTIQALLVASVQNIKKPATNWRPAGLAACSRKLLPAEMMVVAADAEERARNGSEVPGAFRSGFPRGNLRKLVPRDPATACDPENPRGLPVATDPRKIGSRPAGS